MSKKNFLQRSLLAGVAGSVVLAGTAVAQEAAMLDEIVVTATKRQERMQDVPQSINVVGGEQLQELSILTFQDIKQLTPGLNLSRNSGDEQSVSLRGVKMPNGNSSNATNTVDVYFNEVPQSVFSSFSSLYDVGQIEVLRGPQGTLRGRTSPSGSVLVTTRRPGFDVWEGDLQATVGTGGVANIQGGVGGPVSETFALRVAGVYDENDGNRVKNITLDEGSHQETKSARLTAEWRPVEELELSLIHQRLESNQRFYRSAEGTGAFSLNGGQTYRLKDRVAIDPNPNRTRNEFAVTVLNARYDLGSHAISYIGGYQDSRFDNALNINLGNAPVAIPYATGGKNDSDLLTQEVRFESLDNPFWNYMVGAYYERSQRDTLTSVKPFFTDAPSFGDSTTRGLFTTQRFALSDADKLELGLRYTDIDIKASAMQRGYDAVTGNVSYTHRFSPDLMVYASYGTSYRPGGYTDNVTGAPVPAHYFVYDDEKSQSAELGLKSNWLDGRLELNANVFHQKFDGYIGQFFLAACTGAPNANGLAYATNEGTLGGAACTIQSSAFNGDALSTGAELEARALITDDWSVNLTLAYADARYDKATIPCNDYNGDGTPDAEGVPRVQQGRYVSQCVSNSALGQLPKFSATLGSNYEFPLGSYTGFARGLVSYQSKAYFPQTAWTQRTQTLADLYLGFRAPSESWELTAYAKNLFDNEQQDTEGGQAFSVGRDTGFHVGSVLKGRELGLTLRYRFGS
ncbi:TonB-dependent receptor [Niveispirillum sp. BGYR6]|uniref:TonB-dependent receptor n=1 Tax=Niveispirillum sp. BGYR6 TaxID=2971249 RepID=UPI0022B95A54|nr:TonB-dependent receptor [Niveispirillum sp. BGYR6]MDG5496194.1 TonB-dependent receptor [Niveispirillum sp. BGYR6]